MAKKDVEEKAPSPVSVAHAKTGYLIGLCIAAWLVPGLGHFILGRRWRALILFASILTMFLLGLAMKGEFFATGTGSLLANLGHYGELAVGVAMPAANFFGYAGDQLFVSSDYGTAYLVTAGMLNILCILDAFDIAMGRKSEGLGH
jgi:hypothetical protein